MKLLTQIVNSYCLSSGERIEQRKREEEIKSYSICLMSKVGIMLRVGVNVCMCVYIYFYIPINNTNCRVCVYINIFICLWL